MTEKQNSHGAMDPMNLWKQWNTSTSTMWSNIANGNKESFVDPYGLYQAWIKSVEEVQGQLQTGSTKLINPEEFWKSWSESMADGWRKAKESGTDLFGLSTRWLELMEESRAKMFSNGTMPTDPFSFYKQWYDAISETWSKVVGDLFSTEEFTRASSEFLKNYLLFVKSSRHFNEEYFRNLQIPTLSDIARVAEQIVLLEDKVDKIEDAVEDFSDNFAQLATNESIVGLTTRMDRLENQLTTLPATLEQGKVLTGLANRMNSIEQKLTTMETVLEGANSLTALEGRIDQVESKLDKVLVALERIEATSRQPATAKSANTPSPRSKKSVTPSEDTNTATKDALK